ncbi:unnamed protein product [Darwinula stevensoni]|uniref:Uncharacterized protein n=1 Tax=Darwinula stevensoni TaxID=69355 RepID=A0A7R8XGZ6_9CRUS|nr:unnamed protein product [Darwinula stevensoni]CAG0889936.1 unnamed protein product [Darwinula stevensoni]
MNGSSELHAETARRGGWENPPTCTGNAVTGDPTFDDATQDSNSISCSSDLPISRVHRNAFTHIALLVRMPEFQPIVFLRSIDTGTSTTKRRITEDATATTTDGSECHDPTCDCGRPGEECLPGEGNTIPHPCCCNYYYICPNESTFLSGHVVQPNFRRLQQPRKLLSRWDLL